MLYVIVIALGTPEKRYLYSIRISANRLGKCPLRTENEMEKTGSYRVIVERPAVVRVCNISMKDVDKKDFLIVPYRKFFH